MSGPATPVAPATPAAFAFDGQDALAQFLVLACCIVGGGIVSMLLWAHPTLASVVITTALVLLLVPGFTASIEVGPGAVTITKRWYSFRWCRVRGTRIDSVAYGANWGLPEGAIGVAVEVAGRKVHIGSGKTMRQLHEGW